MADAKSKVRKDKAGARVSRNDVQTTERAAVEAEERAHRAKQALKKAKKESRKAHKAARRARRVAHAARKAMAKADAHGKKKESKKKKSKKADGKKAERKATKRASRKAAPPPRKTAQKKVHAPRPASIAPALAPMEEPDTFALPETH